MKRKLLIIALLIISSSAYSSNSPEAFCKGIKLTELSEDKDFTVEFNKDDQSVYGYLADLYDEVIFEDLTAYRNHYSWPFSAASTELLKTIAKKLGVDENIVNKVKDKYHYSLFLSNQHTDPAITLSVYEDRYSKTLFKVLSKEKAQYLCIE